MNNKFNLIQPAQEMADNKKRLDITEQGALTPSSEHPNPASTVPSAETEPEPFVPSATQQTRKTLLSRVLARSPVPLQQTITKLIEQVEDPYPERMDVHPTAETHEIIRWGWLPVLTLSCAVGLFCIASGFAAARNDQPGLEVTFIAGLLLIFVPTMIRQLSPGTPRPERIATMCVVGLCLYLINIMASPTYFSSYDQFLHWLSINNIAATGHLFSPNSLLPVSPYYPGLEIVTNALSTLSGLDSFYCGLLVIGVARIIMVLAFFLLNEQIINSPRIASISTLIYMTNPHFLIFDSQYAYESLALPLATCVLFMITLHQSMSKDLKHLEPISPTPISAGANRKQLSHDLLWITCITCIVIGAVVFTHHVTGFFLDGILILWLLVASFQRKRAPDLLRRHHHSHLAKITLIGIGITVLSVIRSGNPVVNYLGSFFGIALKELSHIIVGSGSARPLFQSYTGIPAPLWERLLTIAAQGLVMLGLPVGLLCLWKRHCSNALVCTFSVMALAYPLVQIFRFTTTGSELVDRSAAFLFISISSVLAILIIQLWPVRRLKRTHIMTLTSLLSVIFLGSTISGLGPGLALLPGKYMVLADSRSIEPEGIQAATWAGNHLGTGNRAEGDRINNILMATYGHQRIVTTIQDGVDGSPIFLAAQFNPDTVYILKSGNIRYLIVDMRISQHLPVLGFYYSESEFDAFKHRKPPNPQVLTKFDTVPRVNKIFSSGNIVIYDMEGVIDATA
jgi:uncharacterized membrane protein